MQLVVYNSDPKSYECSVIAAAKVASKEERCYASELMEVSAQPSSTIWREIPQWGDLVKPMYLYLKNYQFSEDDMISIKLGYETNEPSCGCKSDPVEWKLPLSFYKTINKVKTVDDYTVIDLSFDLFSPHFICFSRPNRLFLSPNIKADDTIVMMDYLYVDKKNRRNLLNCSCMYIRQLFFQPINKGYNKLQFGGLVNGLLVRGDRPVKSLQVMFNGHNRSDPYGHVLLKTISSEASAVAAFSNSAVRR